LSYGRGYLTLADLYLSLRRPSEARDAIRLGLANLDIRPFLPVDTARGKNDAAYRRREWLPREARLALLQGDSKQALALFQRYLTGQGRDVLAAAGTNANAETQATIAEAKALYLTNGGDEAAWFDWATSSPDVVADAPMPVVYNTPLPDFEAKDLTGRIWRLADLRGKATFIEIWATWCGPCRAQHPDLQKQFDGLRGRKDIQILTISVDETAYLAEAYMKEHQYAFPVIVSKDLAERLFPGLGYPQEWIVDATGRRSSPVRLREARLSQELEKAAFAK
jgi:peroxiredoxin